MPDPEKLLKTIRRAYRVGCTQHPGRVGGVITLDSATEVLRSSAYPHGNIPAFRKVLDTVADTANPGRHLVLQELASMGFATIPTMGGGSFAPTGRCRGCHEMPVPRPGPCDPG